MPDSITRFGCRRCGAAPTCSSARLVFEFKSDLRREIDDVSRRLPDYLAERERQTRRRYLGMATDGATFIAFELRQDVLIEIGRHDLKADGPEALLAWLEPALSDREDLIPVPIVSVENLAARA